VLKKAFQLQTSKYPPSFFFLISYPLAVMNRQFIRPVNALANFSIVGTFHCHHWRLMNGAQPGWPSYACWSRTIPIHSIGPGVSDSDCVARNFSEEKLAADRYL
jgi:hypothetical protein